MKTHTNTLTVLLQNFVYAESCLLFVRVLRRFQQFFCHITTVPGCDREVNAHFYSAASLKYHAPDT